MFPDDPQIGDEITLGGRTYQWAGNRWRPYSEVQTAVGNYRIVNQTLTLDGNRAELSSAPLGGLIDNRITIETAEGKIIFDAEIVEEGETYFAQINTPDYSGQMAQVSYLAG